MFRGWQGDDAELMYYNKSIELLALLCVGEDRSGVTSYVTSVLSADNLVHRFLEIHEIQWALKAKGNTNANHMCRTLKGSLLLLLHHAYYHTDMKDVRFWNSQLHINLLSLLTESLERVFSQPMIQTVEEGYVHRVLRALNAYLEYGKVETDKDGSTPPAITALFNETLLKTLDLVEKNDVKVPQDQNVFIVEVRRLRGWISGDDSCKTLRPINKVDDDVNGFDKKSASSGINE